MGKAQVDEAGAGMNDRVKRVEDTLERVASSDAATSTVKQTLGCPSDRVVVDPHSGFFANRRRPG